MSNNNLQDMYKVLDNIEMDLLKNIEKDTKRLTPVDTGHLKNSWSIDEKSKTLGNSADYSAYVEATGRKPVYMLKRGMLKNVRNK